MSLAYGVTRAINSTHASALRAECSFARLTFVICCSCLVEAVNISDNLVIRLFKFHVRKIHEICLSECILISNNFDQEYLRSGYQ